MRLGLTTALAALAGLGLVQAAAAADIPMRAAPAYKAAPMAPAFSWTGFYVGAHVGGAWGNSEWTFPGFFDASINTAGFIGGGQAGYNWQINQIVFGIEGDISGSTIRDTVNGCFAVATQSCTTRVDWTALLTARLGYAFGQNLIYIKGGGAWAEFHYENPTPAIPDVFTASKTRDGWTIGAGWEYAFAPAWSAKIEYNYLDFGTNTLTFTGATGAFVENIKDEIHQVKVGVNYRPWSGGGMGWR